MTITDPDTGEAPPAPARRVGGTTLACWLLVLPPAVFLACRLAGFDGGFWPLVDLPALTPYAAVAALIPLAVAVLSRRWAATVAAAAVLVAFGAIVLPRALGGPDPARGPELRVMAANMKEGGADPAGVVALARSHRVDLLSLSELTPELLSALDADGLTRLLPYVNANAEPSVGGTALFSRYPLANQDRQWLLNGFVESTATVLVPGARPVEVTAVHYCAPADPTQMACWRYGVAQIPSATPHGGLRLLLGDFNLTVDYRALRQVLATGYRDAGTVMGQGLVPTWPYDLTPAPKVTIDHVLADRRIGIGGYGVYPIPRSDHRAVYAALTIPS